MIVEPSSCRRRERRRANRRRVRSGSVETTDPATELVEIAANGCHWPVGEGGPMQQLFCNPTRRQQSSDLLPVPRDAQRRPDQDQRPMSLAAENQVETGDRGKDIVRR